MPTFTAKTNSVKQIGIVCLLLLLASMAQAQYTFRAVTRDRENRQPLARVTVKSRHIPGVVTNDSGYVQISGLDSGAHSFTFSSIGYADTILHVVLPDTTVYDVLLAPVQKELQGVTIVSTTRTEQRIENAPLKVEVLGQEELAEEGGIRPGNIASLIGDVSGIQIQQSSPTSGNSNVRIQGLEGRYTQILRDGMPLYDGFSGGFSIMQIPPLDLRQIELVKGSASTLYGGGAIGGLINLISRRPTMKQEGVLLLNQTTLKETDVNSYIARRYHTVGYSFFTGYTHQTEGDVNDDGLSDVPHLDMLVVHPRLFFYPGPHATITAGYTGTWDNRKGGDMQVLQGKSDNVHRYFEYDRTGRHTGELMLESRLGRSTFAFKNSASFYHRQIRKADHFFRGRQLNYYSEASVVVPTPAVSWVGGVNAVGDRFTKEPSDPIALPNSENNTLGAFVQATVPWKRTTLEAGLRNDYHFTYGNFLLPRLALFHRFSDAWATRMGVGWGYKTPNPLAPQIVDYDIEDLQPLPAGIRAEESIGYNVEVNYKQAWDKDHTFFVNQALFLTRITDPVIAEEATNGNVFFSNAPKDILTRGFDTYVQVHLGAWELYSGYTYTVAQRRYLPANTFMPLTPRNRFAFVTAYELGENWRLALEGSYTGRQFREDGSPTPGYLFMAAMIGRELGHHLTLVLNGENLLDYRQSKHEPLYTGSITDPHFVPLWAPIDGRVLNLSLKWDWGKRGE